MAAWAALTALGVVGNGESPICSAITSLPAAWSFRATASTSNAVSVVNPAAKEESVGVVFMEWDRATEEPFARQRNRFAQGGNNAKQSREKVGFLPGLWPRLQSVHHLAR